jgi:hypothetical protein
VRTSLPLLKPKQDDKEIPLFINGPLIIEHEVRFSSPSWGDLVGLPFAWLPLRECNRFCHVLTDSHCIENAHHSLCLTNQIIQATSRPCRARGDSGLLSIPARFHYICVSCQHQGGRQVQSGLFLTGRQNRLLDLHVAGKLSCGITYSS